jgi:hypothetical protein
MNLEDIEQGSISTYGYRRKKHRKHAMIPAKDI